MGGRCLISIVSTPKNIVDQQCFNEERFGWTRLFQLYISFRHGNGLKLLNEKEIIFLEENRDILFIFCLDRIGQI